MSLIEILSMHDQGEPTQGRQQPLAGIPYLDLPVSCRYGLRRTPRSFKH